MPCPGFIRARSAALACILLHLATYTTFLANEVIRKYEDGLWYIQASTIVHTTNLLFGLLALTSFLWPRVVLVLPLTCFTVLNLVVSTCAVWAEGAGR